MDCQGIISLVTMIAEVIMALCAIATILYTARMNNDTAKENRKTAEINSKMSELKYRQLIIDANNTFIKLSQNNSVSGIAAINSAKEQLLNAYEVICYLKRNEILSEDFRALYGNEMLKIINSSSFRQIIDNGKDDFKYIRKARALLEKT